MWGLVLSAVAGGGLLWGGVRAHRQQRMQVWQDAVELCGLAVEERSGLWGAGVQELKARSESLEVRIDDGGGRRGGTRVAVVISGAPDFSGVKIRREVYKPAWGREIEIGEESFDRRFYITGPARLVRALLDDKVRRLMVRVNAKCEIEIVEGELRAQADDLAIRDLLPLLLELGGRLSQPIDTARRLAENARRDPKAGVRLQNLLLLIRELPEDPRTVAALRGARSDSSPRVRLRAAKALGAEGRDVLLALAESGGDDDLSAQAISALERDLPSERARAILFLALDKRRIETARACLERLRQGGETADIDALARVMAREQGELAVAAALALGKTGSGAEPPLIQALLGEQKDLRVAAAEALGRVGTAAAVLPLKEVTQRFALHLELRSATRQAIAEIQSRLSDATPGQLSLAGDEAGHLSLAADPAGQLSISSEDAGR